MSAHSPHFLARILLATVLVSSCTTPAAEPVDGDARLSSPEVNSSTRSSSVSSLQAVPATETGSVETEEPDIPSSVLLPVPFSPQAPFAEWDPLHEEACEEMSLILVMHYLKGERSITREQAEQELQELVAWETEQGYGYDVTAEELAEIARKRYGLYAETSDDVTEETIKRSLAAGRPLIIPAAGRMLGNPYFSGEGPWYHMLVITGYREGLFGTTFIANDVGTRRGEKYEYDADVLLNAIHDWTGVKEETAQGKKTMLTVLIRD